MKRIVPILLSLLLVLGCIGSASAMSSVLYEDDPSATPPPSPESADSAEAAHVPDVPDAAEEAGEEEASQPCYVSEPMASYLFFDQPNWDSLTSDVMFRFDLDQDGTEEDISFALDRDEGTTAITWGDSTVVLDESEEFVQADVVDLDPESPFYNLLVILDYGSDSYITIELHPENGQLVKGPVINGSWAWEDGALWFYEQTDFLGTAFGQRPYSQDSLVPNSEWLDMCYIPTEEDLETEREDLINGGTLLHTILPVPCTIDGQPGLIPEDTYLYRLRFRGEDDLTEVALPDGTVARIACTVEENGWPYLIDGRDMEEYFDNLFFAD